MATEAKVANDILAPNASRCRRLILGGGTRGMDMVPDGDTGMLNSLGASTCNGVLRRSKRVKRTFLKGRSGTIAAFTDMSCCREVKPDGGPMSARSQTQKSEGAAGKAALPSRADMVRRACHTPKVLPKTDTAKIAVRQGAR